MNRKEIYQHITDKIIEQLKKGTIPWRKPWRQGLPSNYITRRPYNGINRLSLLCNDYPSPYYLTYLQIKQLGGRILKDEKGHLIVFWKVINITNEEDEHVDEFPLLRYTYVFNLSQTNLYKPDENELATILECERLLSNVQPVPDIRHNTSECFYDKRNDYISIPPMSQFTSREEYYSSLYHELIHWTGHISRLNRQRLDYAMEELVAEIGSSYLCAITGISPAVIHNQTAYIEYWLKMTQSRELNLITASKLSQSAINLLIRQYACKK